MLAGQVYTEKLGGAGGTTAVDARMLERIDSEIVREIYLAAYTRPPETQELQQVLQLISASQNRDDALKDFVWAILCSREFAENH